MFLMSPATTVKFHTPNGANTRQHGSFRPRMPLRGKRRFRRTGESFSHVQFGSQLQGWVCKRKHPLDSAFAMISGSDGCKPEAELQNEHILILSQNAPPCTPRLQRLFILCPPVGR